MAVPYNLSGIENVSGPLALASSIDANAGSWFFGSFLIFVWLFLIILFRNRGNQNAMLGASFIVTLLTGAVWGAGLLDTRTLTFPVLMLIASLILKVWGEG